MGLDFARSQVVELDAEMGHMIEAWRLIGGTVLEGTYPGWYEWKLVPTFRIFHQYYKRISRFLAVTVLGFRFSDILRFLVEDLWARFFWPGTPWGGGRLRESGANAQPDAGAPGGSDSSDNGNLQITTWPRALKRPLAILRLWVFQSWQNYINYIV